MSMQEEGSTEAEPRAVVALYDPATGKILHFHYSAVDIGSELPGPEALEREALEHATRHAPEGKRSALEGSSFLHVDPRSFTMGRSYNVDTERRILVEVRRES